MDIERHNCSNNRLGKMEKGFLCKTLFLLGLFCRLVDLDVSSA